MVSTRRSARISSSQDSSPPQQNDAPLTAAGAKRKSEAGASPSAKRGKKSAPKEQKTIEETMDTDPPTEAPEPATDAKVSQPESSVPTTSEQSTKSQESIKPAPESQAEETPTVQNGEDKQDAVADKPASSEPAQANGDVKSKSAEQPQQAKEEDTAATKPSTEESQPSEEKKSDPSTTEHTSKTNGTVQAESETTSEPKTAANGGSAVEAHARDQETPASILEKGIIYFFFRGRVGIDNPSEVGDIARSYMVLRPLPHGAKLGDGPIGSGDSKCRLLALPKKVLPVSGNDKFMTFVEQAKTTFPELRDSFMSGSDYDTQTAGARHTPAVTPIAEGVYAITTTGRESHLAYMLSIPQTLGEVQKDMGLREQGSFVVSLKNPDAPGPASASLPQKPDFPQELKDKFRTLRWMPLEPQYLDYENTQFLLIGESDGVEKAFEETSDNQKSGATGAQEAMEKLEGEDEIRVQHLKGDDAVFADLGISKSDYPKVPSTWN